MKQSHPQSGFTLVELMIAVIVVGVLTAIALPSFMESIRKGRRAEAFTALSSVQQAQERYRSNQAAYAGDDLLTTTPGLAQSRNTPGGYYGLLLSGVGSSGYTVTATAASGTSQASDAQCQVLAVRVAAGNISYGSGSSGADFADPNHCWAK